MNNICPKCNILMVEATVDHSGIVYIYKGNVDKGLKLKLSEVSNIRQVVCPSCGYIEFYAEKPEKFK